MAFQPTLIYFTICEIYWEKNEIRKWRFLTSALSCSRFFYIARRSTKSFQRWTAHGRWPAVNLKEGMSNLFLFPILQECASTIFLNLLQIRGWRSPLTCVKLGVPSGKYQRGEFVYLLWNVPIQILATFSFFHNFRGLKWIPL